MHYVLDNYAFYNMTGSRNFDFNSDEQLIRAGSFVVLKCYLVHYRFLRSFFISPATRIQFLSEAELLGDDICTSFHDCKWLCFNNKLSFHFFTIPV